MGHSPPGKGYNDRHRFRRSLIFSLLLPGYLPASAAFGAEETHTQWSCRNDAEGQWNCVEEVVPGKAYRNSGRVGTVRPKAEADEPRVRLSTNLDWLDASQMTDEQRQALKGHCCGAYVEPPRDYLDSEMDPDQAPLRVGANSTEAQGTVATLEGDVQVSQGYRQIRSDTAIVDQAARTVELEGNIQLREPGLLMLGDNAYVNIDSGDVRMNNATYVIHETSVRGTASQLSRGADGIIYVDDATYTSCEPGSSDWDLVTTEIKVNVNNRIVSARNVRLHVNDWPVFYLPWIRFSLSEDRASGLLFPNIRTSNDNGLDFAQPIYLNLAPNYDATITPRHVEQRGTMAEVELRHMSKSSRSAVSTAYLWEDKGGREGEIDRDPVTGLLPHEGEDRWLVNADHEGGIKRDWSTRIDYTEVSDGDYFIDLDNATLEVSSQSHLSQQVAFGYQKDHWRAEVTTQRYQTIARTLVLDENGEPQNALEFREQYQQLPRFDLIGNYRSDSDLVLTLDHELTFFEHRDDDTLNTGAAFARDTRDTQITGNRLRTSYQFAWDQHWLWGFFRPSVTLNYLAYDLDDPLKNQTVTSPTAFIPTAALDTGLYFERETSWFGGNIQTLEPRLFYLYSELEDQSDLPNFDTSEMTFSYQQLFRQNRFSGGDRISDADQVTLGVTTRLIEAGTGIETFHASFGQIFYLADRHVTLSPQLSEEVFADISLQQNLNQMARDDFLDLTRDQSDYAAEMAARFLNNWEIRTDILFNDDSGLINKGSFSLRYNDGNNQVFNISYRYTRRDENPNLNEPDQDIEQTDTSFFWPLVGNWSAIGRWSHDLTNSRELEVFTGLEYNNCCWRASLVARRWLDRDDIAALPDENLVHDKGIFFQVLLKGLAGSSSSVDNILTDSITGYRISD